MKKGTIILIVVLLLASFIGGMLFEQKQLKERYKSCEIKKEETPKEEEEEEKDTPTEKPVENGFNVSSVDQQNILSVIRQIELLDEFGQNIDENNKLSDQLLLEFVYTELKKSNNAEPAFFTLEQANAIIQKYFGINAPEISFNCLDGCKEAYYIYDATLKRWTLNGAHTGHELSIAYYGDSTLIRAVEMKQQGTTFNVKVVKAFRDGTSDSYFDRPVSAYYKKIDTTEPNKLFAVTLKEDTKADMVADQKNFDNYDITNLPKYDYVFEKSNGNYVLKSYMVTK